MSVLVVLSITVVLSLLVIFGAFFRWGYIDCCEEKAGGVSATGSELRGLFYDAGRRYALSRFEELQKLSEKISKGETLERMLTHAGFSDIESIVRNECDADELREVLVRWRAKRSLLETKLGMKTSGSGLAA